MLSRQIIAYCTFRFGLSSNDSKTLKQTNQRQNKRQLNTNSDNQLVERMKKSLTTIKLDLYNPEQATNYATVAETAVQVHNIDHQKEVRNVNKQRSPGDSNKILGTGKQKFRKCDEVESTFAKLFSLYKRNYAFTKVRGNTDWVWKRDDSSKRTKHLQYRCMTRPLQTAYSWMLSFISRSRSYNLA